ncbi:hypothetical protein PCASD_02867 [Puccinia coronata f. sp. avenae]|uniref:Rad21/Rec8-like protein N-terminal domain-containing protein n=1 Tax=Puccinia coronata f. sp. avenae TaxID=200324 RepID=A0A2N5VEE3_9BASI|nr:hypothetical protein PCASD_02867 [Puccinia coronata f. sp. avenae]
MFFSSEMLSKRGPLAKVWLAAHVERKVSKAQTLQTSIPSTVTVILEPASTMVSAPPLALRLSGQLLLGIARIYSKQAKYLLEDCNEASDKIRTAFRSETLQSMIDETAGDDHLTLPAPSNVAGRDAINIRSAANRNLFDFELEFGEGFGYGFGDGWEDLNQLNGASNLVPIVGTSRSRIDGNIDDITLTEHQSFRFGGDQEEPRLDDMQPGDADMMGGNDELDLGVAPCDGPESEAANTRRNRQQRDGSAIGEEGLLADETMEMEVGRDAPGTADRRSARDSLLPGQLDDLSVDKSHDMPSGMGDVSFDLGGDVPGFEPNRLDVDSGLDLGLAGNQDINMQDNAQAGGQDGAENDGQRTPRATTPAPNPMLDQLDVTPRTSHRLAPHLTSPAVGPEGDQQPPKKKPKHQLVDRVTELATADHLPSSLNTDNDPQSTLDPPRFLPKDRYQLQHHRLMLDPSCHEFLPKLLEVDGERWLMAAPAGLCKELQELFKFPARASTLSARGRGTKRLRADEEEREELESELGRRAPSVGLGDADFSRIDTLGDETFDLMGHREEDQGAPFGADDGFQFELQDKSHVEQESSAINDAMQQEFRSEVETDQQPLPPLPPAPDTRRQRAEGETSKLDVFDDSGDAPPQSQIAESMDIPGTAGRTKWSKNTVKALTVLKTELADESQVLQFKEVSKNASRRAGAAFFFELLVLGTRDCLKLNQSEPFGEIEVRSQDRLWEVLEEQAV